MNWDVEFRIREYLRGSLWTLPLVGAILGLLLGAGTVELDRASELPAYWSYSPSTATSVLSAIVGATAALTGFVVTVTVLVVQMATGTFSARYMRLWYRDRMLKVTLAVLVGTLTFSFSLLRRVESDFVPDAGVTLAGLLVTVSLLLFLLFFDRFIHRLRPVAVTKLVADAGRRTFDEMLAVRSAADISQEPYQTAAEPSLVVRARRAGSIQAFDSRGLVHWARSNGSVVVLPHAVGDFVPEGSVLMRVYGDAPRAEDERKLRGAVALGDERTIQEDPAFALRIMVDIALMALSPAVNAPTTAVQVLDHLGETLRQIGTTDLERRTAPVEGVPPALVIRVRRWEDFLTLGVTEIREYGASSIQVLRCLRAMLDELLEAVRPEHRAAVQGELARLDATVRERWAYPVDLDLVSVADGQGLGGPAQDGGRP
jgi:uncharacterized membrane protein